MKHKRLLLFLLTVILIACMSVGAAHAYFTDSVDVKGGYVLNIGYTPPIYERIDGNKHVWFQSEKNAPTVFVRARAYTGAAFQTYLKYTPGENWVIGATGEFYYYILPLEAEGKTTELQINVTSQLFPSGALPGDEINVIVVYESTPAIFTEDGEPDFATAWGADAPVLS